MRVGLLPPASLAAGLRRALCASDSTLPECASLAPIRKRTAHLRCLEPLARSPAGSSFAERPAHAKRLASKAHSRIDRLSGPESVRADNRTLTRGSVPALQAQCACHRCRSAWNRDLRSFTQEDLTPRVAARCPSSKAVRCRLHLSAVEVVVARPVPVPWRESAPPRIAIMPHPPVRSR